MAPRRCRQGTPSEIIRPLQGQLAFIDWNMPLTDKLIIAAAKLKSRLFIGTAGYRKPTVLLDSLEQAGPAITMSIQRISLEDAEPRRPARRALSDLPNTSGCVTARDAILTAELARAGAGN